MSFTAKNNKYLSFMVIDGSFMNRAETENKKNAFLERITVKRQSDYSGLRIRTHMEANVRSNSISHLGLWLSPRSCNRN